MKFLCNRAQHSQNKCNVLLSNSDYGFRARAPRLVALAQPPLGAASLCSNLRYTFLMHDPLRRAATLLLERCPYGRRVRHCECLARSLAPLA